MTHYVRTTLYVIHYKLRLFFGHYLRKHVYEAMSMMSEIYLDFRHVLFEEENNLP